MKSIKRFLSSFSLVTRIPLPDFGKPDLSSFGLHFPIIGIIAGFAGCSVYVLSIFLFSSPYIAAGVSIAASFFAFDLFHFDGLLDSADALMPFVSREKRLEILSDPRTGSFGTFAGILSVGILWVTLGFFARFELPAIFAAFCYPVAARSAAGLVPLILKPAKTTGLGAALIPYSRAKAVLGMAIGAAVCAAVLFFWARGYIFAVAASYIVSFASTGVIVVMPYAKKLGGFTGDTIGAAVIVGGVSYLLSLSGFSLWLKF